ncbi:glycosyltransferase [Candidatus Gottesmanbacteria bacterium]|nr:glycosyltransferase [Candidatus Gottesmanbacteria bacterium]
MKNLMCSIVIPNWNGIKLLQMHLAQVVQASLGREIIFSDDASTDESVDFVSKSYPDIVIVKNSVHKGFSSTVNAGVSRASGDIVFLLNTDVIPEKSCIDFLLPHFADEKVFAVGCLEHSHEKNSIVFRGNGEAWWEKGFYLHKKGSTTKSATAWVSGGSGAFRRNMWERLGGMDPLFDPFYWEDIDLSYRAVKAGYTLKFEKNSIVHHYHEKGKILTFFSKTLIQKIVFRNQFIFIWKNMSDKDIIRSHFFWLPVRFMQAVFRFDLSFIAGFLSSFLMLPKVLKRRWVVQKSFILRDRDVVAVK